MIPVDAMFVLATAAFAFGISLASYRWFAVHNGWPMGEWQAHRPGLPIAIGLVAVLVAMLFAIARGGPTMLVVPILGILCALTWIAIARVGAQVALLLAPVAVLGLLALWINAASKFGDEGSRVLLDQSARTVLEGAMQDVTTGSITRQPVEAPQFAPPTR